MKIASFESLEYLFTKNKRDLYAFSFAGSPCEHLTDANFGKKAIKIARFDGGPIGEIWADDDKIFQETDFLSLVKKNKIAAIQLDTHSSDLKENIALGAGLQLVVTPWKLQEKFENKLFFDAFLRKNRLPAPAGFNLTAKKDIENIKTFPLIVQVPISDGSKGTFLVKNRKEFSRIFTENSLSFPLLAREFIAKGFPIGVSLLIGPKKMVFSAMRLQAYFNTGGISQYCGIQWLKRTAFPEKTIKILNKSLVDLGHALQRAGFRGVANIDLIINNDKIYFIECNPRLGGSTPQIALKPELIHGFEFVREFYKTISGKDPSLNRPFIPNSDYQGFNMDIDFIGEKLAGKCITRPWKTGFYKIKSGCLVYISSKLDDFTRDDSIFVYHALSPNRVITKDCFLGFVMVHKPFVDIKNDSYKFNNNGAELKKFVYELMKGGVRLRQTGHL